MNLRETTMIKKFILFVCCCFCIQSYSMQYKERHFEKTCKRCHRVSIETQMYVWDEWHMRWMKSWRSDMNRPDLCMECHFAISLKPHFLQRPMNAYSIENYDVPSNNEDNSNYTYKWWNNGAIEKLARSKPIGIGWTLGRLR